jgi:hypothetical protein
MKRSIPPALRAWSSQQWKDTMASARAFSYYFSQSERVHDAFFLCEADLGLSHVPEFH